MVSANIARQKKTAKQWNKNDVQKLVADLFVRDFSVLIYSYEMR